MTGDLIYIRVFGNPILVINSAKAAADLLDKRSSVYSSRPVRTMVSELCVVYANCVRCLIDAFPEWAGTGSSPRSPMVPGGSNTGRSSTSTSIQLPHQTTTPFNTKRLVSCCTTFLQRPTTSLTTFEGLCHHFPVTSPCANFMANRTAAAIIMQIIYGHQVAPEGDVFVTLADRALETLGHAGIFGTYLVDYIPLRAPFLPYRCTIIQPFAVRHIPRWMPGASFKRKAFEWRQLNRAMLDEPYQMVKDRTVSHLVRTYSHPLSPQDI